MQIELKSIKIRDLIDGYVNDPDIGVKGYHGKLDIRPPYQREFRYDEKQQQAVVETILKGFPLNIMYWSVDGNGNFEMIDGNNVPSRYVVSIPMISISLTPTEAHSIFLHLQRKRKSSFLITN